MKTAVLIKQVPDSDEVKMNPETGTMIREGTGNIVNPLDLNALECALELRAELGGTVTVISMGPPQACYALREALALGADNALLVSDRLFAGADSWATSLVLAKTLDATGPYDLVLAGEKATDGETGQVGPEVAAMLDIPCSTYVSTVKMVDGKMLVSRTVEDGLQKQRIQMPCLLTVLNNMNEPGMPTLKGKKRARRETIETINADCLALARDQIGLSGSPTKVVKIGHPKLTRQTEKYAGKDLDYGIDRVVDMLREIAVI